MVAYTLPARTNRTAIRDGRRYIMLAAPRGDRRPNQNPHVRGGARLHLRTARSRTSNGDHFPEMQCAYSGLVTFSVEGVVRVLDQSVASERDGWLQAARLGEGVSNLLAQAEQASAGDRLRAADRIAEAAGFRDHADLWASIRKDDGEVVARQLIAWQL